ncbi:MAG: hypothetical protein ACI30J_08910 [Paludibacteraceae bacterium]
MVNKIFQALKQEYPQLGLGDEILQARAEALAATGLVTDENLTAVVASQKANLEALQKSNDKRVADALAKSKKDADAAAEKLKAEHAAALKAEQDKLSAAQKKLEEKRGGAGSGQLSQETQAAIDALKAEQDKLSAAQKKLEEKRGGAGSGQLSQETQAAIDALKAEQKSQLDSINETIKALKETNTNYAAKLKAMEDEKAAAAKAAATKARLDMIVAKAKEVGIPEWRINQGFNFADDMDETKITETLTGYAADIKKQMLPTSVHASRNDSGKTVSAEEARDIVKGILRK